MRTERTSSPFTGEQAPPEIPAWLESLKAGEHPVASQDAAFFPVTDLPGEGSVPGRVRLEQSTGASPAGSPVPSSAQSALRQASTPGPLTGGEEALSGRLEARSLIDEQSLPAWMQKGQSSAPSAVPESGFSAGRLIDPDALPEWMKLLQPPQQSSAAPFSQTVAPAEQSMSSSEMPEWMKSLQPSQASPASEAAQPPQGALPRDVLDEQSLAAWIKPQEDQATHAAGDAQPDQSGKISPASLIDEEALPPWMKSQEDQAMHAAGGAQPGQPGKISPASLIDKEALPTWIREQEQSASAAQSYWSGQPAPSPSPVAPPQSSPTPQVMPPGSVPGVPASGQGLSASSFIDTNALPEWLKRAEQPGQPGQPAQPAQPASRQQSTYSMPPSMEKVRAAVPSRPRTEWNASETSEVAANVFASMLGVASAAPQFPAPANVPYGQGQTGPQGQSAPGRGGPQGIPQTPVPGAQVAPPPPGQPVMPSQGYAQQGYNSYPGYQGQGGMPGGAPISAPPPGPMGPPSYPGNMGGMASMPGVPPTPGAPYTASRQKGMKKRGIFEALRDWLTSR
ncbi:MAG: hypothetical protein IMW89_08310 [Ktedonobacteraceae bacterium]|nr:hypothetical protein [Ktedonobacteraceae bacterium]